MTDTIYDFAVGRTNPATFPIERVQEAAVNAIAHEYAPITAYPGELGHAGLRAAMARRESEREGVDVDPDSLSLMNGSMQAVTLSAEALTRPGDTVILEEFTYSGTIRAYRTLEIDMIGIPVDHDGMRVDMLQARIDALGEARKPKFIYALTTYQNPTGTVMSEARRHQLVEIAQHNDIPIIEDNCYGDVHYDGAKPKALYAMSDYEDIIYICSLSKILAPGMRLGYLMAKPKMLRKILDRRNDAGSNYFTAAVVAELYKDGIWDLTESLNVPLKDKKNLVVEGLGNELEDLCAWSNPVGGLFIWLRFPNDVDREKMAALAAERGVRYAAGSNFHIRGDDVPYLRLAFGHVPDDAIREGIPLLAQCIREARTSNEPPDFEGLFD
ncbi:MAG: PLP-dependent aminotransferase family protein [Gammaproteobacteria bacterium]|nr:PLP-dependent aminotransferase family protein [Gammaproteobacteria bacterium]